MINLIFWQLLLSNLLLVYGELEKTPGPASPTSEQCSRTYFGQHGIISSYNYPFDYPHNLTCTYSIYVTSDPESTNVICFTFRRFLLERSTPFCTFDYLKLEYNDLKYCAGGLWMYGVQTTSPGSNVWSKNFCWTVKNTKTFDMTFSSDNNINGAGFYAEYFIFPGEESDQKLPPGNLGQAPCSEDEWTCFNRRCVGKHQLCDGEDNCGDDSDESYAHARCGERNVLACDFTAGGVSDGYCGFTHEGWFRTKEALAPYGPQGDHTNGTSGFYVYSDVNQSSVFLLSPELSLPRNKTYCLSFWYYIYGRPAEAILRVYVTRDQAYSRPEWSRLDSAENEWIKGEIVIYSLANIQVIFAAELDNSFSGVSLDDVSILPGTCMGDDVSCNFESGTCAWNRTHSISHHYGNVRADLMWQLHSRVLGATGPSWDHSSKDGGGFYLYLNNTNAGTSENRALLVSPPQTGISGRTKCLQWWYHMSGQDRDCCQLRLRIHDADDMLGDPIWTKMGDVRNAWKQGAVNLDIPRPYQVVIEGMVSLNSRSQIALDELLLTDGPCAMIDGNSCGLGRYLCADGQCINSTQKCDGKFDCFDRSDEDSRAGCAVSHVPQTTTSTTRTTTTSSGTPHPTCPPHYYRCVGDGQCIPEDWVCDKFDDCPDRSDESSAVGCSGGSGLFPCREGRFLCNNGRCIKDHKRCDGTDNCGDNSDETQCTTPTAPPAVATCLSDEFVCLADQSCIPRVLTCDGHENCADGSDETFENASCQLVAASGGLGAGVIVGIVLGVVLIIAVIILSAFLGRRRRKPRPRRRAANHGSEISTITEASTMERHMSMLEAIREPMRNLSGLPPYSSSLENLGYTSDGTFRQSLRGVMLPPEEPPPPYDAVIKESGPNTPDSIRGYPGEGETPEDDSYGFRSRSRSGSARHSRRKSRERGRSQDRRTQERERQSPAFPLEPTVTQIPTADQPSEESDTQNIYEELNNVSTLRPNRLRNEPSSSATLQNPNQPTGPTYPVSNLHSTDLPAASYPVSNLQSTDPPTASYTANNPQTSNTRAIPNVGPHSPSLPQEGVTSFSSTPPLRTLPQQRIRLGTQALQNRGPPGRAQPHYGRNPALNASLAGDVTLPRAGTRGPGYEHLDPPGPYNVRGHPYTSIPPQSRQGGDPSNQLIGQPPAGQQQPHMMQRPDSGRPTHRLYGSARNPPRNYGTNRTSESPGAVPPHHNTTSNQRDPNPSNPQTSNPQPINPALSPRVMPNPRPYGDSPLSFQRAGTVPSPLQSNNYLYRPRPVTHEDTPSPSDSPFTRVASPAVSNHSRDWNNSSFASSGSQEQLIGSPGQSIASSRYSDHPRAGSNISSDSTSPLVTSRDQASLDLDMLTPTAV